LQRQGEPTTVSTVGTKRDHESDDEDPEGDIRNASIPSKKKYKPQLHSAMRINFRCKTGRAFGRNLRRERSFGLSINGSGQCTYRLADRTSDPEERIPFSVRSRTRTRKMDSTVNLGSRNSGTEMGLFGSDPLVSYRVVGFLRIGWDPTTPSTYAYF